MATVNFSVPDDIKEEFNRCFAGQNKSAILSGLMKEAILQKKRQERRQMAIDTLLEFRQQQPKVTDETVQQVREEARS